MFFFIGGIQPKTVVIDKQAKTCPGCGYPELYLKRVDRYFSLFFIPLFPVKKGVPFLTCENCNAIFNGHGLKINVKQPGARRRCPHCGKPVEPDFSFCPYCGKAV